jgi:outer membrane lipoprotein-sorting protein
MSTEPNSESLDEGFDVLRRLPVPDRPADLDVKLLARLAAEPSPAAAGQTPNRVKVWDRMKNWMGGLSMRQRMALGGVGVAAVLAPVLIWGAMIAEPIPAMAQMAQKVREAQSYEYTMIIEMKFVPEPGKPPVTTVMRSKVSWLAPGSYRIETKGGQSTPGQDIEILPAGKPGLQIDKKEKTFQRLPARQGKLPPFLIVEGFGRYSGQADRDLGTKEVAGKKAHGFQIAAQKIDPDSPAGVCEIWIDPDSKLPVLVRLERKMAQNPGEIRMEDFHWNIPLDAKLFDTQPPAGYTDKTSQPPPLEKQVHDITEALKFYAEIMDGHYPRVKRVYGDATRDELLDKLGVKQPLTKQYQNKKVMKVMHSVSGLARITVILRENPDAAYYGKTVGPKDKDKVLLRWKLDDGKYEVIFGDLHAQTVTAKELRTLEGKGK